MPRGTTRRPIQPGSAPAPTAVTTPTISCPITTGVRTHSYPGSPRQACTSLPQSPQASICRTTSPGPRFRTGTSWTVVDAWSAPPLTNAGLLDSDTEIRLPNLRVVAALLRGTAVRGAALLDDGRVVGGLQSVLHLLLDEEDGHPGIGDLLHEGEHVRDDHRRQAQ